MDVKIENEALKLKKDFFSRDLLQKSDFEAQK